MTQLVKKLLAMHDTPVPFPGREDLREKGQATLPYPLQYSWASLVAQLVKNPPAVWETWVRSLGWEDPLEKGKTIHFCILAWRIPGGTKESDMTERLSLTHSTPTVPVIQTHTEEWVSGGIRRNSFSGDSYG